LAISGSISILSLNRIQAVSKLSEYEQGQVKYRCGPPPHTSGRNFVPKRDLAR
jgi:hypothetical protein